MLKIAVLVGRLGVAWGPFDASYELNDIHSCCGVVTESFKHTRCNGMNHVLWTIKRTGDLCFLVHRETRQFVGRRNRSPANT